MDIGRQGTEIEWFLTIGTSLFCRSTFGPQLEHAAAAYYDSDGHRIPRADDPWSVMAVPSGAKAFDTYRMDVADELLVRLARVSRRMRIIETQAPALHATLVAYHGNTGSRWALEAPPSGRLVAVYPLTTTGAKWIEALIAREQSDRTEHDAAMGKWRAARAAGRDAPMPASPPPMLDLRPDERLANEAALQRTRATDIRRARLVRVEREATELVGRAHALYAQIDGAMWDATRQARVRRIMAARAGA